MIFLHAAVWLLFIAAPSHMFVCLLCVCTNRIFQLRALCLLCPVTQKVVACPCNAGIHSFRWDPSAWDCLQISRFVSITLISISSWRGGVSNVVFIFNELFSRYSWTEVAWLCNVVCRAHEVLLECWAHRRPFWAPALVTLSDGSAVSETQSNSE